MASMSVKGQQRATRALGYVAMAGTVLLVGLPIWWMISGSLKSTQEIYTILFVGSVRCV